MKTHSAADSDWPRRIVHMDLDAFYPSVEALDQPALRGLPVIVGGLGRRGVVASSSYEAREFGVHSAMPMALARRLCPQGIFLRPRFDRYREVAVQVRGLFSRWTSLVEPISLDEAYLDLSHRTESPVEAAREIKAQIRAETGLTASAGVAENKFLAKLASDQEKPDGLTVIPPGTARAFLWNLPVERLWGVGPATAQRLRSEGCETIGQVAEVGEVRLVGLFGKWGRRLAQFAIGEDDRPVEPPGEPKSISSETTFERDRASWEEVWPVLETATVRVADRLARSEMAARTVTLKARFPDYTTITRSLTPGPGLARVEDLLPVVEALTARIPLGHGGLRLVGVEVSNLQGLGGEEDGMQLTLWSEKMAPGRLADVSGGS